MSVPCPICPPDAGEHCLFGLRHEVGLPPAVADEITRAIERQRRLADLAMSEEEWARRYAESTG